MHLLFLINPSRFCKTPVPFVFKGLNKVANAGTHARLSYWMDHFSRQVSGRRLRRKKRSLKDKEQSCGSTNNRICLFFFSMPFPVGLWAWSAGRTTGRECEIHHGLKDANHLKWLLSDFIWNLTFPFVAYVFTVSERHIFSIQNKPFNIVIDALQSYNCQQL